jgi:hypothetical protein
MVLKNFNRDIVKNEKPRIKKRKPKLDEVFTLFESEVKEEKMSIKVGKKI